MSADTVSTLSNLLYELKGPLVEAVSKEGPFMAMLRRDLDERKRKDDAYLAGLDERERVFVLRMRRHAALRRRFLEALDFSPRERDDDW